jgi:alpha-ribazole phosphatase
VARAASEVTTRWWWVRHAPVAPPHDRGFAPPEAAAALGDAGPLAALAEALPDSAVWIASPMRRALATMEALLAAKGIDDADTLVEIAFAGQNFGDWHGLGYHQIYAGLDERGRQAAALARPPRGETFAEVVARVGAAIDSLSHRFAGRDIVAVAHAGTVQAALTLALGGAAPAGVGFTVELLSVTRLDRIAGPAGDPAWRVGLVNGVAGERGRWKARSPIS